MKNIIGAYSNTMDLFSTSEEKRSAYKLLTPVFLRSDDRIYHEMFRDGTYSNLVADIEVAENDDECREIYNRYTQEENIIPGIQMTKVSLSVMAMIFKTDNFYKTDDSDQFVENVYNYRKKKGNNFYNKSNEPFVLEIVKKNAIKIDHLNGMIKNISSNDFSFANRILQLPTGEYHIGNRSYLTNALNSYVESRGVPLQDVFNLVEAYTDIDSFENAIAIADMITDKTPELMEEERRARNLKYLKDQVLSSTNPKTGELHLLKKRRTA